MDQVRRALAPSPAGNRPLGVNFYSYANTNIMVGSAPAVPNSEFHRPAGEALGGPVPPSVLPLIARLRTPQGEFALQPLYAGLAPYLPGRYQVNVQLPEGVASGELRWQVGEALSDPLTF
jgi:hypothetical protein